MGEQTNIQWCDHTFNPWWGCFEVSPACDNCYAREFSKFTGHAVWGVNAPRRFFGDKHWAEPLKWNRDAEREGRKRLVFCASMADWAEDREDLEPWRWKLWGLIESTPWLTWQLLTKRPQAIKGLVPPSIIPKVWLGTTIENPKYLELRGAHLFQHEQAQVLFFSCEPLLEEVLLGPWLQRLSPDRLWVIAGGESGGKARQFQIQHARSIRDECAAAGVPFLLKQLGKVPVDGKVRLKLVDRKHGGDINEWPADLRVREFPKAWAA